MGRILKAKDIEATGVTVKNVRLGGQMVAAVAQSPPLSAPPAARNDEARAVAARHAGAAVVVQASSLHAQPELVDPRSTPFVTARSRGEPSRPEACTTIAEPASEIAQSELAEDLERARRVLQEIADRLAEHDQRMAEQGGRRLIDLGVAIARRILREQVELDPTVVQRAAREALEEASGARDVEVRVNPRDLPVLDAVSDVLLDALDSLRGLTVVPDPEVEPGGVVLHTDVGVVDGQIETQLDEVRAALVELDETSQIDEQEL